MSRAHAWMFGRRKLSAGAIIATLLAMIAIMAIIPKAMPMLSAPTPRVAALRWDPHFAPAIERGMSLYREAEMTPLRERQWRLSLWDADNDDSFGQRGVEPVDSRGERRRNSGLHRTYRTLCVRLCDGYYF